MNPITLVMTVLSGMVSVLGPPLSTAQIRPAGLSAAFEAIPLGPVRVTQYTHVECRSRTTASGYELQDSDEGKVCAVSRDWWKSRVQPGDLIWVEGYAKPCVALDSMADANRKGFPQRRWIDIYVTNPVAGLDFGIRRSTAYLIRPRAPLAQGRITKTSRPRVSAELAAD